MKNKEPTAKESSDKLNDILKKSGIKLVPNISEIDALKRFVVESGIAKYSNGKLLLWMGCEYATIDEYIKSIVD